MVDPAGQPIAGATASLQATSQANNGGDAGLRDVSSVEGRVEFSAFPMEYSLRFNAEGFKSEGVSVDLSGDAEVEQRVQLFPTRMATVRVEWRRQPVQQGGGGPAVEATNGSTTMQISGDSSARRSSFAPTTPCPVGSADRRRRNG